jgi:hypothetical protein
VGFYFPAECHQSGVTLPHVIPTLLFLGNKNKELDIGAGCQCADSCAVAGVGLCCWCML